MKKEVMLILLLFISVSIVSASGEACDLNLTLLNQDPYPAVPGDYVKLVFQIEGIDAPECGDITFSLLPDYPLEFDPGEAQVKKFSKIKYVKDYKTNILVPYEVRIDENALDGESPIEVKVQSKGDAPISKIFNLKVDDVRANFEIYVKDYSYTTDEITLEALNIGSSNIEALTIEIPKQENIEVKGPNRAIVGDLDSNEYTTADFEAIPKDGKFTVNLIYSDKINTRRTIKKTLEFDSTYFTDRKADQSTTGTGTYIIYAVIVLLIGYWIFRKVKKSKDKNKK